MRVLVYPDILHGGEVHSLSVNKSNDKLLTGGNDGKILLWNVQQLVNLNLTPQEEMAELISSTKPQKEFSYHTCNIKVIKWSPIDDNIFVSGDKSGCIYMNNIRDNDPQLVFSPNKSNNSLQDTIYDIAWSHDGRLLSWSGDHGKVFLYDLTRSTYQELTSLIKLEKPIIQRSLAFDPNNNYLITLGDDTIIHLYQFQYCPDNDNNYQFKLLQKISRLMNQSNVNVNYKRISWSPGGQYVSIPSASESQTTLISLLSSTDNWSNNFSLIGHNSNCQVVQFNPKFFKNPLESSEQSTTQDSEILKKYNMYNTVATAGGDKSLVLWNTSKQSPMFVLQDVVSKPIVDLCWDKSGNSLFMASLDGHLTLVTFEDNEIGEEVDIETINNVTKEIKSFIKPFNAKPETGSSRKQAPPIEILDGKNASLESSLESDNQNQISKPDPKNNNINDSIPKDKEPSNNEIHESFAPQVIPTPKMNDPTAVDNDILSSAMESRLTKPSKSQPQQDVTEKNGSSSGLNGTSASDSKQSTFDKQKMTTKNGKKRVQPLLVSNGNNQPAPVASVPKASQKLESKLFMELDKPSYNIPDDDFRNAKRLRADDDGNNKKRKRDLEPTKFIGSVVINPNVSFSKMRLGTPKIRLNFLLTSSIETNESFVLDIKNGTGNEAKPSRITYYKKETQIWCDFIPRFIHLVTEGQSFWAMSTNDGQILTYSHVSGKKLLPTIILGSPLSFLESHNNYLMAITCVGELFVWDMKSKKSHLNCPLSLAALLDSNNKYQEDVLSKSDNITLCSITSKGIPLITLSNGTGYLFNKDLGTWQILTESWWAFGSHYWNSLEEDNLKPQSVNLLKDGDGSSIIGLLEQKTNEELIRGSRTGRGKYFNKISKNMLMKEGFENLENTISVSHLENRILCSELLGEKKDFHYFLIIYFKRICELGLKAKVFEVCNQLLGPEDNTEFSNWNKEICGIDKHQLLKEIIMSCVDIRDSQRILTHFGKKIGIIDDSV